MKGIEINYYWYHHGLAWCDDDSKEYEDYNAINKALECKQYDKFIELKKEYPDCLPDMASLYDNGEYIGDIDITIPENFMYITYSENECG